MPEIQAQEKGMWVVLFCLWVVCIRDKLFVQLAPTFLKNFMKLVLQNLHEIPQVGLAF